MLESNRVVNSLLPPYYNSMVITVSNATKSLAAALKDMQRLEAPDAKKKEKDTPVQTVAKAVSVAISSNAKMQILNESLN